MHIIQKNILDMLRQASTLRYSELQPRDIESSHFKYHLTQLQKDGLVEQEGRGVYKLSEKGQSSVDRLSGGRINPHLTPKVITYTLLKDAENYYLQVKPKDPYRGLLNMIGGKVHLGESGLEAAQRELQEKTGNVPEDIVLCGVADILIGRNDALLSHVTAYVYVAGISDASVYDGLVAVPVADLARTSSLAPDLLSLIDAVETGNLPFVMEVSADL
jgi:ADP-ribose pyrophosphatase YjhB (NUDIX family)